MHFAIVDVLTVTLIGLVAIIFLVRLGLKMRKDKTISLCSGCTKSGCSSKSFAKPLQNTVKKS